MESEGASYRPRYPPMGTEPAERFERVMPADGVRAGMSR
jgi:hypothetical protein